MIIDIAWVLSVDFYIQYSEDRLIQKGVKLLHVHDLKLVFYEIFMGFDHGVLYAVFWQILCSFWTSELILYKLLKILPASIFTRLNQPASSWAASFFNITMWRYYRHDSHKLTQEEAPKGFSTAASLRLSKSKSPREAASRKPYKTNEREAGHVDYDP